MKVAFASCFDALDDSRQEVWKKVQEIGPDVMLFLGDNVYMDYGPIGKRPLAWPVDVSEEVFATTLYSRYVAQWGVPSFQKLIRAVPTIGITWDDHDFAWDNSRGASRKWRYGVPKGKRRVSQGLFELFKTSVRNASALRAYPEMPPLTTLLETPDTGIQESFDVDRVRFLCLDGRSFRQDPKEACDTEMHGLQQRKWAEGLLRTWKGVSVIAAGSVMSKGAESWDRYVDYKWLLDINAGPIVVLTGDLHKNVAPKAHRRRGKGGRAIYEVTSSGAARPKWFGESGNFGLLTIEEETVATIYSTDNPNGLSTTLVL